MTTYHNVEVEGLNIFYREAGKPEAPTLVLLHGFPSSSHMFRGLLETLADSFYLIAPDYPGYGNSASPAASEFEYSFDKLAIIIEGLLNKLGIERYSLYMQDYGAPIGFRLASQHPDKIERLVIQNGNIYLEGVSPALDPLQAYWQERSAANEVAIRGLLAKETTVFQYTQGAHDLSKISPDAWNSDQYGLDRPGNQQIQFDLFYDYRNNVPLLDQWQAYLRQYQPPTLVVWGQNDPFFTVAGAEGYRKDLNNVEIHLLDTGHFALEEELDNITGYIKNFWAGR